MSAFADYLHEVFAQLGPIRVRRMFGGYGVYHEGWMFALVSDDTLYFKVDEQTRADFEARSLAPFVYKKDGRALTMSYRLAPAEIYDDPEQAKLWAERALAAAKRTRSKPSGGKARPRGQ